RFSALTAGPAWPRSETGGRPYTTPWRTFADAARASALRIWSILPRRAARFKEPAATSTLVAWYYDSQNRMISEVSHYRRTRGSQGVTLFLWAVHFADGFLQPSWLAAGWLLALALALVGAWGIREEETPRIALLTAV